MLAEVGLDCTAGRLARRRHARRDVPRGRRCRRAAVLEDAEIGRDRGVTASWSAIGSASIGSITRRSRCPMRTMSVRSRIGARRALVTRATEADARAGAREAEPGTSPSAGATSARTCGSPSWGAGSSRPKRAATSQITTVRSTNAIASSSTRGSPRACGAPPRRRGSRWCRARRARRRMRRSTSRRAMWLAIRGRSARLRAASASGSRARGDTIYQRPAQ